MKKEGAIAGTFLFRLTIAMAKQPSYPAAFPEFDAMLFLLFRGFACLLPVSKLRHFHNRTVIPGKTYIEDRAHRIGS